MLSERELKIGRMKLYFVLLMLLGSLYASFFYVIKGVTLMQFWGATVITNLLSPFPFRY